MVCYSRRYGIEARGFHLAYPVSPIRSGHSEIMQCPRDVSKYLAVFDELIFFVVDVKPPVTCTLQRSVREIRIGPVNTFFFSNFFRTITIVLHLPLGRNRSVLTARPVTRKTEQIPYTT